MDVNWGESVGLRRAKFPWHGSGALGGSGLEGYDYEERDWMLWYSCRHTIYIYNFYALHVIWNIQSVIYKWFHMLWFFSSYLNMLLYSTNLRNRSGKYNVQTFCIGRSIKLLRCQRVWISHRGYSRLLFQNVLNPLNILLLNTASTCAIHINARWRH